MSSQTAAGQTPTSASSSFWYSRLGSFLAVFPLGVWTIHHVWENLAAWRGGDAWQREVTQYDNPFTQAVTVTIALLPLLIHTVWGIGRLFSTRPNFGKYPTYGNFKYILQRLSAIGVLLFLGAHIWQAFLSPRLVHGHAEQFADIAAFMHHNVPTLVVYVLGTLGVAYHLAHGLWSFCWSWGLAGGETKAFKRMDVAMVIFFVVFLAMSWGAIFALYQAGGAFPDPGGH